MSKKTPRQKLVAKLDNIVKQIVRLRDNGCCQYCGKPASGQNAHTAHVYAKKTHRLRWDLLNLLLLCFHCHIEKFHRNPFEIQEGWFRQKYPARYEYLQRIHDKIVRYTNSDLELKLIRLTMKLRELRDE